MSRFFIGDLVVVNGAYLQSVLAAALSAANRRSLITLGNLANKNDVCEVAAEGVVDSGPFIRLVPQNTSSTEYNDGRGESVVLDTVPQINNVLSLASRAQSVNVSANAILETPPRWIASANPDNITTVQANTAPLDSDIFLELPLAASCPLYRYNIVKTDTLGNFVYVTALDSFNGVTGPVSFGTAVAHGYYTVQSLFNGMTWGWRQVSGLLVSQFIIIP